MDFHDENNSTENTDSSLIPFPFWNCFFLDSEHGFYPVVNNSTSQNVTYYCVGQGAFISPKHGLSLCTAIAFLVWLFGLFGLITNIVNIMVLNKSQSWLKGSFKFLWTVLISLELATCFFVLQTVTIALLILHNISRGKVALYFLMIVNGFYVSSRIGALYLTVVVTIERYFVVVFPMHGKQYILTPLRTKRCLFAVLIYVLTINIGTILDATVTESLNLIGSSTENPYLSDWPVIYQPTDFLIYVTIKIVGIILLLDYFVAPFALLSLNGHMFWKIHSWNKNRKKLTRAQKKEIKLAKMFSITMLIMLICHTISFSPTLMYFASGMLYRELVFLLWLSITVSSSVNILVYLGGKKFREELKSQINRHFGGYIFINRPTKTERKKTENSTTENFMDNVNPDENVENEDDSDIVPNVYFLRNSIDGEAIIKFEK